MRVLYLINHAGKGGSEKYVRDIADYLRKKGESVFFAYNESGELSEYMKDKGVKTLRISMSSPLDIAAAKKLAKFCKDNKIDVIHAQFPRENYIAVLAKMFGSKAEVVYTSHINLKNNIFWKVSNIFFTRKNGAIIAVCSSVATLLADNGYPRNKICVIFNGVEVAEVVKSHEKSEIFTFITVARLSEEKGLMFLLQSVNELKQEIDKPFKMLIVGDGPTKNELENYIEKNELGDYVELTGYHKNPEQLLQSSHVFINSSNSEALSFAILEAMAHSLPVIATNIGGNPDIVNQKTGCGVLVEYNDTKAMAKEMKTLMTDHSLYEYFAKNAYLAAKSVFNIEEMASTTYNLYKEVIEKNDNKRKR